MSQTFGASAVRLAGIATRLLGWQPDHFWRATPAELAMALMPMAPSDTLSRDDLTRLMEHDDDRRG